LELSWSRENLVREFDIRKACLETAALICIRRWQRVYLHSDPRCIGALTIIPGVNEF